LLLLLLLVVVVVATRVMVALPVLPVVAAVCERARP
jgi:hypothetical protein